jgi:hypothetical protein
MTTPAPTQLGEALPENVVARATAEGLGEVKLVMRPQKNSTAAVALTWLSLIFGLALFVLPGLLLFWQARETTIFNRKLKARRLYLFENGILVADANGPIHAVRWNSMTVLQQIIRKQLGGTTVRTLYTYTVITGDGPSFKLTNFYEKPEVWGPRIQDEITRTYLPGVMAAIESGQPVVFADTSLTASGMANVKRGELRWSEIQNIEVKNGVVVVQKAGKRAPLTGTAVSRIPNFFVFLSAAKTLQAGAARERGAAV